MFDTHCHLDDESYDADRAAVLARAAAAGVTDVLVPAIRPSTFGALIEKMAIPSPVRLHLALGFHPQVVPDLTPGEWDALNDLSAALVRHKAVAVGECGLDGPTGHIEAQDRLFRAHIRIARNLRLPLIVHAFRTHEPVLRALKEERAHEVGGVIHSFSGSPPLVARYVDLGFALSFAGAVTWPRAKRPLAAAAVVPEHALLAETDGPDQSPSRLRGQRNEPAAVSDVVAALAQLRGQPVQDVARKLQSNAERIFRLSTAT
ncbi:MAG: TatD family hydrolase [Deltaproteobacteria bacterium]|nr:TatD family hydrolase [Deltaproteobacteria bacterium]